MKDRKSINISMNQKERLSKEDKTKKVDEAHFKRLIRCLMYFTVARPAILIAMSILSWFMHSVSEMHLKAAKRVVRYIKGTINVDIKFKKTKEFKLFGFSDSDRTGSIDDIKMYYFSFRSKIFFVGFEKNKK